MAKIDWKKIVSSTPFKVGVGIVIGAATYYGIDVTMLYFNNKKKEKDKTNSDSNIDAKQNEIRDKYKTVDNWDEFKIAVPYQVAPDLFGYNLLAVANNPKASKVIDKETMQKIYSYSQEGVANMKPQEQNDFLDLMHKIY